MNFKPCLLLLSVAVLATSCSQSFYYKPDPLTIDPNNTFISGGVTVAVSQTRLTKVTMSALKPANDQLRLLITYQNNGLERIDAIPDSIKVIMTDGDKTKYLKVYPADEYLKRLQRRENAALIMQGVAAGFNNGQAGYSQSTTTTSIMSSNGTYRTSTSTTTTYDANRAIAANLQSSREIQQAANNYANYNQSVSQNLIRTNTLFRGEYASGFVVVNTTNSFDDKIIIEVPFGNEIHKFTLIPNK